MARLILPYQSVFDLNGHPLPGAKMYFYESETVTPKDTYSDEALTTLNANPVIADSQGQFGDIFLSGAYSCKLDDADDVTQPDYPAEIAATTDTASSVLLTTDQTVGGVKTFTDKLAIKANTPTLEIEENDEAADNRLWQYICSAGQFIFRVATDARDSFSSIFTVDRTGTTVDTVNFLSTSLQHNGNEVLTSIAAVEFDDSGFRVFDDGDNTKKLAFEASGITTATTRTATFPDFDFTIGDITDVAGLHLRTKVLDIGDWDMDLTAQKQVTHGLTVTNIRTIVGMIRSDLGTNVYPITQAFGALGVFDCMIRTISSTTVTLERLNAGNFDNVNFDATSYNRGWLTITYIA